MQRGVRRRWSSSGRSVSATSSRRSRAADAVRQMELDRPEDLDVVGLAEDELEAAVQVFHVRSGQVVGRLALFVRQGGGPDPRTARSERILVDVYADAASGVPRQVLVPTMPEDFEAVGAYLAERRGGPVAVRVPLRGTEAGAARDGGPRTPRSPSPAIGCSGPPTTTAGPGPSSRSSGSSALPEAPLRIECYDMSHLQGTDYVGSMVVFEDGLPKKSDYRHFKVATVAGNDDYAAMEEVLTRRLTALLAEDAPGSPTAADHADDGDDGPDGGPDQAPVRLPAPAPAARRRPGPAQRGRPGARAAGLTERIPVAALAKSFEEVYRPGRSEPIRLSRQSEALYLSSGSGTRPTASPSPTTAPAGQADDRRRLDGVDGPRARSAATRLIEQFGGLAELRKATREELLGRIVVAGRGGRGGLRATAHPDVPERTGDRATWQKVDR